MKQKEIKQGNTNRSVKQTKNLACSSTQSQVTRTNGNHQYQASEGAQRRLCSRPVRTHTRMSTWETGNHTCWHAVRSGFFRSKRDLTVMDCPTICPHRRPHQTTCPPASMIRRARSSSHNVLNLQHTTLQSELRNLPSLHVRSILR